MLQQKDYSEILTIALKFPEQCFNIIIDSSIMHLNHGQGYAHKKIIIDFFIQNEMDKTYKYCFRYL